MLIMLLRSPLALALALVLRCSDGGDPLGMWLGGAGNADRSSSMSSVDDGPSMGDS